ncbi:hypothetical protein F4774DRAFT_125479 [Daldinia eschscholtzii]|nr:hypothetical protein F4774DRAFT_125479 [Daldinia eschscholtzii]
MRRITSPYHLSPTVNTSSGYFRLVGRESILGSGTQSPTGRCWRPGCRQFTRIIRTNLIPYAVATLYGGESPQPKIWLSLRAYSIDNRGRGRNYNSSTPSHVASILINASAPTLITGVFSDNKSLELTTGGSVSDTQLFYYSDRNSADCDRWTP